MKLHYKLTQKQIVSCSKIVLHNRLQIIEGPGLIILTTTMILFSIASEKQRYCKFVGIQPKQSGESATSLSFLENNSEEH